MPSCRSVLHDRPADSEAALDLTRRIHEEFAYDPQARRWPRRWQKCSRSAAASARISPRSTGVRAGRSASPPSSERVPRHRDAAGEAAARRADASHAWVRLFCGEAGWVDLGSDQ